MENKIRETLQAILNTIILLRTKLPEPLKTKLKAKLAQYISELDGLLP